MAACPRGERVAHRLLSARQRSEAPGVDEALQKGGVFRSRSRAWTREESGALGGPGAGAEGPDRASRSPCSLQAFSAQSASEPLVSSERSIGRKHCLCLCGLAVTRPSPGPGALPGASAAGAAHGHVPRPRTGSCPGSQLPFPQLFIHLLPGVGAVGACHPP